MTGATASLPPRVRLGRKQLGFVALCGLLVLGALVAALIFAWPSVSLPAGQFEIGAGALPAPGDDPYFVAEGRFYLVNLEPGAGAHQGFGESDHEGGLLALSTINPWPPAARGAGIGTRCDLLWRANFLFQGSDGWFRDRCAGSTFTIAGIRVFGPSPRSMDTLAVTVRGDGSVVVDSSSVIPGSNDNALRTVPYLAN